MRSIHEDTIFRRRPNDAETVKFIEQQFRDEQAIARPYYGEALSTAQRACNLKGQLYKLGTGVITAEELRWAIERGYVRSRIYGELVTVLNHNYEEVQKFDKPHIEYFATSKGLSTRVWY